MDKLTRDMLTDLADRARDRAQIALLAGQKARAARLVSIAETAEQCLLQAEIMQDSRKDAPDMYRAFPLTFDPVIHNPSYSSVLDCYGYDTVCHA